MRKLEEPVPTEHGAGGGTTAQEERPWQPETLFHTCLSSLASSEDFGPMMAAEADARGFFTAKKKAFLGDGQACNWTIQRRWFRDFVPIADFVHAVEYIYTAAKTVHADAASRWRQYLEWATLAGKETRQRSSPIFACGNLASASYRKARRFRETDPRKIIHSVTTYFTNSGAPNGLPTISPGRTPGDQFPGGVPRQTDQQASQRNGEVLERRALRRSDSPTTGGGDLRWRPPPTLDHQTPNFSILTKVPRRRARQLRLTTTNVFLRPLPNWYWVGRRSLAGPMRSTVSQGGMFCRLNQLILA